MHLNDYFLINSNFFTNDSIDLIHVVGKNLIHTFDSIGTNLNSYNFVRKTNYKLSEYSVNSTVFITGDFDGDGINDLVNFVNEYNILVSFSMGNRCFKASNKFPN